MTFKPEAQPPMRARHALAGLSHVLAAAVVSRGFRESLLSDPIAALEQGYLGKGFSLTQEETALLKSIHAQSLTDLARRIVLHAESQ